MISETITKNDLTAILNEVLPPTPSEYRKLLWTNPSPSSAFGTQTISVDADEYDSIEVEYNGTSAPLIMSVRNSTYYVMTPAYGGTPSYRAAKLPTTNGVYFDECHKNSGATIENSYLVPLHIYGIKYERVLPPAMDALEWKLAGTASGNTAVNMPTEYNEILLWTQYNTVYFSTIVPRAEVPANGYIYPRTAFYYTSASNAGAYFSVSSSKANLALFVTDGGTNYTSSSTFKLYYR